MEGLNVAGMAKGKNLAYSVHDAGMGEALCMLEHKCSWHGRPFTKVARAFSSTRLCSDCDAKAGPSGTASLDVRSRECPECGAVHDRDVNAARNMAKEGARLLAFMEEGIAGTREPRRKAANACRDAGKAACRSMWG